MRKIEKIKKRYLEQVFGIEQLSNSTPWSYSSFLDCMRKDYEFYVCLENEKVQGFFIASFSLLEGHLLNISVAPNMKRQGIGNELLKKVESIANKFGIKEIFLEVRESNQRAIQFYRRNGFQEAGVRKNYYKLNFGREDGLIMQKNLSKPVIILLLDNVFKFFFNLARFRLR